jgi:hypothetical protein
LIIDDRTKRLSIIKWKQNTENINDQKETKTQKINAQKETEQKEYQ